MHLMDVGVCACVTVLKPVLLLCTLPAALSSLRQYKSVDADKFSQSNTASAEIQLTKVKALLREVQSSGNENGHKLESIFRTCMTALQQLEVRAASLSTDYRKPTLGSDTEGMPHAASGMNDAFSLRRELMQRGIHTPQETHSVPLNCPAPYVVDVARCLQRRCLMRCSGFGSRCKPPPPTSIA